jgi:hypothetical protein
LHTRRSWRFEQETERKHHHTKSLPIEILIDLPNEIFGGADRKNKPSVTCFQQVLLISFEQEVQAPGVCTET